MENGGGYTKEEKLFCLFIFVVILVITFIFIYLLHKIF